MMAYFKALTIDGDQMAGWPSAGFVDTQFGCFMKPEVANGIALTPNQSSAQPISRRAS